jgi:uncharacterized membrane protein YbhN (UPF0104 family)
MQENYFRRVEKTLKAYQVYGVAFEAFCSADVRQSKIIALFYLDFIYEIIIIQNTSILLMYLFYYLSYILMKLQTHSS